MKIATYTRISTDEKHQPYSLEAQAHRLGAYAESQEDWQIIQRFTDQKSGATLDRPGLERALLAADAKRFDLLLVYRVDRLARSVRGLAQILERLDAAKVLFRSATEPFDTSTSAGRMMVQMLGVFAEFERATIVERIVAGMERKAARGEWTAGKVPYGYKYDDDRRFLAIDPTEAPIVGLIFERYARRRLGAAALGSWLSSRGYRTRQGAPFSNKIILGILRNRVYIGEVFFRGTYHPSPHPPLVDPELFQQVQEIVDERGEDIWRRRSNQSEYLLTGRVRCHNCGKRYLGTAAHGKGGRYSYYVCFSRLRYGRATCQGDRIPADKLETAILKQLTTLLKRSEIVRKSIGDAIARRQADRPDREGEAAHVKSEIAIARNALERYFRAFEAGTLTDSSCSTRIDKLHEQISALEACHEELLIDLEDDPDPAPPTADELAALQEHVGEVIRDGDPPARRALLQALVAEVRIVSRSEIYPTFSLPGVRATGPLVPPTGFEPVLPP